MFEQATELLKRAAKEKLKKAAAQLINKTILTSPIFWGIVGVIVLIFASFYLLAAAISSTSNVVLETQITEGIVPPQIQYHNLEDLITSDFGPRINPVTMQSQVHEGIDIGIPTGTPIISSFDGRVTRVSYPKRSDPTTTQNAGIYINIESIDSEIPATTRYLHLSNAFVTTGQMVTKGEIIGLSGNTGRSTGAHLHYEMIPAGEEAMDPKPFIILMSNVIDVATEEAFKVMRNISFSNIDSSTFGSLPYYESSKMLYINGVYLESASPYFSTSGSVQYSRLVLGGTIPVDSPSGSTDYIPSTPEQTVTVPVDLGRLTHPFFIENAAAAQREERRSGIPASITLAQAALESAYGRSSICNNMFGIKANRGYSGPTCTATTHEEVGGVRVQIEATFRAYSSKSESLADHSKFLLDNPRYRRALSMENPYAFANELQRAGYATDSQYANKLKSIMRSQNLTSLDANQGIDPGTGEPFEDVPFYGGGSGGGNSSANNDESITIIFGIRQYYGTTAAEPYYHNGSLAYRSILDPLTDRPIINLENYYRVVQSNDEDKYAPNIYMKDIPDAISVTIQSEREDDLYVSNVEYIRGGY